jgi:hypothetical protein
MTNLIRFILVETYLGLLSAEREHPCESLWQRNGVRRQCSGQRQENVRELPGGSGEYWTTIDRLRRFSQRSTRYPT